MVEEEEGRREQVEPGQTWNHLEVSWASTSPWFCVPVLGDLAQDCVDTQCPVVPNDLHELVDEVDVKNHDEENDVDRHWEFGGVSDVGYGIVDGEVVICAEKWMASVTLR